MIALYGGWGYDNLGDEAILAGYLEFLRGRCEVTVASVDPERTRCAQSRSVAVVGESWKRSTGNRLLLGGGGYINGGWIPQIYSKLGRLALQAHKATVVAHGIEVRRIDGPTTNLLASRVFRSAQIGVRDQASSDVLSGLTAEPVTVLPDAISLLVPHLKQYIDRVAEVEGRVLLNLLDITSRPDSAESLIDNGSWIDFCDELIEYLGPRALGLAVGAFDTEFMKRWPGLEIITPMSVRALVSSISSADAIFSVRMHPALIASGLKKPVVSVPYCGKVLPTLTRIGIQDIVLGQLDVELVLQMIAGGLDHTSEWAAAYQQNQIWLESALALSPAEEAVRI